MEHDDPAPRAPEGAEGNSAPAAEPVPPAAPAPAAPSRSWVCTNHPAREGIGICVVCRRVVCVECSTKIDGVNHCRGCLASRSAKAAERRTSFAEGALQTVLAVAVVAASLAATSAAFALIGSTRHGGAASGR